MPRDRFLEVEMDRSWIYSRTNGRLPAATARAAGYLRTMRDRSRDRGTDFVVALLPAEIQVDRALQDEIARASGGSHDDFDFREPSRAIAAALAADGIRTIDLGPAFADAVRARRLYKPLDTHWNLAGNRLAAEVIEPVVREMIRAR
jgi:hypothetical protein